MINKMVPAVALCAVLFPCAAYADEVGDKYVVNEAATSYCAEDKSGTSVLADDVDNVTVFNDANIIDSCMNNKQDQEQKSNKPDEETDKTQQDAHFYIRYDSTVQDEDGTTHYDPSNYFPIGATKDGYAYGSNKSDYSSIDGKTNTKSAYVPGAEGIITNANVNLYDEFGKTIDDTENGYFSMVYEGIVAAPPAEIITCSIENALGKDWMKEYNEGRIGVLWYVIKDEGKIHVDGVLYWKSTGDVVDKDSDIDKDKLPLDPGSPDGNSDNSDVPDADNSEDCGNDGGVDGNKTEQNDSNVCTDDVDNNHSEENNMNNADDTSEVNTLPQTSDNLSFVTALFAGISAMAAAFASRFKRKVMQYKIYN